MSFAYALFLLIRFHFLYIELANSDHGINCFHFEWKYVYAFDLHMNGRNPWLIFWVFSLVLCTSVQLQILARCSVQPWLPIGVGTLAYTLHVNVTLIYKMEQPESFLLFNFNINCMSICGRSTPRRLQLDNISIACIAMQSNQLDLGQIYRLKPLASLKWHLQWCMQGNKFLTSIYSFLLTPLNQIEPFHENRNLSKWIHAWITAVR